ncbi:Scr1 family TA system antitoxin-like transcriptional regulator [Streptomyces litmocidini]|uniref:Scr1 family TA system antitoxin-like transcriptional regulator n=1 Tax=Streptomyces litmocidini TaxID=67318 RepID=UPI0036F93A7B
MVPYAPHANHTVFPPARSSPPPVRHGLHRHEPPPALVQRPGRLRADRARHAVRDLHPQLGEILSCTGSLAGQIETAGKVPSGEFPERLDAALMTGGTSTRWVGSVLRSRLPTWFQMYAETEARATYISSFRPRWVAGLPQTPEHARAGRSSRAGSTPGSSSSRHHRCRDRHERRPRREATGGQLSTTSGQAMTGSPTGHRFPLPNLAHSGLSGVACVGDRPSPHDARTS